MIYQRKMKKNHNDKAMDMDFDIKKQIVLKLFQILFITIYTRKENALFENCEKVVMLKCNSPRKRQAIEINLSANKDPNNVAKCKETKIKNWIFYVLN